MQIHDPYYDPQKSYQENCEEGPFGAFQNPEKHEHFGPTHNFLGFEINTPFGIPAGPLPTSNFVMSAFDMGFDLPVYKTVRTQKHDCHPWPNVVPVDFQGNLTFADGEKGLTSKEKFENPLAITNSFGVPSFDPDFWQEDMQKAANYASKGQMLIASFQGTARGSGEKAYIEDFVTAAKLVAETGVKITEINLSCPNEGKANLLCHDTQLVIKIAEAVKNATPDLKVILKMAYLENNQELYVFLESLSKIVEGFSFINTIPANVYKENGEQALPGEGRVRSGVCGAPIKWAGQEMIERSAAIRKELKRDFALIGTGGVTSAKDYHTYRKLGADAVMSATGSMWNPYLAQEIKKSLLDSQ